MTNHLSRRAFMAGAAATAVAASPITEGGLSRTPQVCVFSKHLQFITDYDELARTYKDLGLDGVDLTVRSGGHVLPEHVARDLPRAVRAFRSTGLGVPMITTRLNRGDDPNARPILETAAREGIQYFRVGGLKYADAGNPLDQLPEFTESLRSLAQLAGDLGMIAGYHNHSGTNQVGAPLWDLHHIIETVALPSFESNFDVGHATIEGGYGAWLINARLLAPHVKMMAVKDFVWKDGRVEWVPLGQGWVKTTEFLRIFREAGFAGPISIHVEYRTPSQDALLEDLRAANQTLRACLADEGYGS